MQRAPETFLVVIHDVAPCFAPELFQICERLAPLIGDQLVGAVVPRFHGQVWRSEDTTRMHSICAGFDEILIHGLFHLRGGIGSLTAWGSGWNDEFSPLSGIEARRRIVSSKHLIAKHLGREPSGFLPPAWCNGKVTPELAFDCDLDFHVDMRRISHVSGIKRSLATFSWDLGWCATLGYLGELWGRIRSHEVQAIPCVAIHPRDVRRGFFGRSVALVQELLARGARPLSCRGIMQTE